MFMLKKKISSRTSWPISIKHPWAKGILNYTDKGPGPLQRRDNYEDAKIWRGHGKSFSLRTTEPE
jgi:hypothetical protein